ncbi:MAG TPA: FtsX-like permease family protein [Terriglobia bacterium]|nr:FtsX-like permease family protein [Terriglobia bacterium]
MHFIRLMWKNSLRNGRRTMLTISSITICIFLISTLQAVLSSIYRVGNQSGGSHLRVIVHRATGVTQPLPISYRQKIGAVPGVRYVVGTQWFGGQYIDASNFFANFAVDTDDFEKVYDNYQITPDQLAAWKNERTGALVGEKLMETYHWQIGQRITLKGTIFPNFDPELTIRAVYHDPEDESQERALYFHYDYLDQAMLQVVGGLGTIGTYAVKVDNAGDMQRVQDAIDAQFRNTAFETKTDTEQAFALSFVSMLGNIKLLLTFISGAVIFTILFVVGNTMSMSIRERTGEVAVLKTLGFRRNTILMLLAGESVVIAMLGGLLGSVGAKLAYAYIVATVNKTHLLGALFAVIAAAISAVGMWSLFAGTASRGWLKGIRILTSLFAAVIGLVAAFIFYTGVGFVANQGGFLADFKVPTGTVFACLGIAAAVGLISAALPALRASRISIAEALRYLG